MSFNLDRYNKALATLNNLEVFKLPLHVFERIPSTNQKLWELIDQGEQLPVAAIALSQTAGRGQWGKQWQSQPGGLYLSVGLLTQIPVTNAAHLTLVSAWGIANALHQHHVPVQLKWLNDLILDRRKLGGIKCETRLGQGRITQAVIGIGINWTNSVPEGGINLQAFVKSTPAIASLEALAALTVSGLFWGYQRYLSAGIDNVLSSYLKLLNSRGRSVLVNGCPGVVVGVTSQGELRVRLHSVGAATEVCLPPGTVSLGYDY